MTPDQVQRADPADPADPAKPTVLLSTTTTFHREMLKTLRKMNIQFCTCQHLSSIIAILFQPLFKNLTKYATFDQY